MFDVCSYIMTECCLFELGSVEIVRNAGNTTLTGYVTLAPGECYQYTTYTERFGRRTIGCSITGLLYTIHT